MSWREDDDVQGNFLSCKVGKSLSLKVKEINKVVGQVSNFNYKRKDNTPVLTRETKEPFHHEIISGDDRILTIGSLSLMGALKNAAVEPGDDIRISHPKSGLWVIEKKGTVESEADDDLPF